MQKFHKTVSRTAILYGCVSIIRRFDSPKVRYSKGVYCNMRFRQP